MSESNRAVASERVLYVLVVLIVSLVIGELTMWLWTFLLWGIVALVLPKSIGGSPFAVGMAQWIGIAIGIATGFLAARWLWPRVMPARAAHK